MSPNRTILPIALATALALLPPVSAHASANASEAGKPGAGCKLDLRIQSNIHWRGAYGRGYEVFSSEEAVEPVALTVRHEGRPCRFALVAMPQASGATPVLRGPVSALRYDVTRDPRGQTLLSSDYFGTAATQILGEFGPGEGNQSFTVHMALPPGQIVPAGLYTGGVIVRLFELDATMLKLRDEGPLSMSVPVMPALEVNLAGSAPGARQTSVDLGDLSNGVERSIGFTLRSNADVRVDLRSANHGTLAHEKGAPGIPYSASINGAAINLRARATNWIRWDGNGHFRDLSLDIQIPALPRTTAAGRYKDTIHVTFTAEG